MKSVTTVVISESHKAEFLQCLKQTGSLAARVALVFKSIFDATFEESESDNEFAVAKIVKAQLVLLATDAGYAESTAERILSECLTANGLVKATSTPRTGKTPDVIPTRAYTAAAAAIDVLAGNGTLPSPKVLGQVGKILRAFGLDEENDEHLSLAAIKAYRAPVKEIKAVVEAGKVVTMPVQGAKSAKAA